MKDKAKPVSTTHLEVAVISDLLLGMLADFAVPMVPPDWQRAIRVLAQNEIERRRKDPSL